MGVKSLVKQVLVGQQNKAYEKRLASKVISYDQWIREKEQAAVDRFDGGKNMSVKAAKGELVYFISQNGRSAERMEAWCQHYFAEHTECMLAYGDEDVWQEGGTEREMPWFKPDWSPDLLDTFFYFGSVVVLRRELYEWAVQEFGAVPQGQYAAGDERGVQQEPDALPFQLTKDCYGWIRQCARLAGGYTRGGAVGAFAADGKEAAVKAVGTGAVIAHIPLILFHCDTEEAIQAYSKCNENGSFEQYAKGKWGEAFGISDTKLTTYEKNKLSIIIPSKDNPEILEKCMQGIWKAVGVEKALLLEIIVVDNGSSDKNKQRIETMLQQYCTEDCTTSYLYEPMEFHFSRMCNLGAEAATGNLLLFLNDDVELCQEGCLERMAVLAARAYTGAVGLKLYYPQSIRMQHAGITNLPMGPVHKLQFLEDNTSYYFNTNRGLRNVLAVTAACLMVETEKFLQTGGFAEELRVAFNDVDLCFQLYELGYANVCVNDSFAYHHESLSRGDDEAPEKLARLLQERATLYQRHPGLENVDPYFSQMLSAQGLDTGIRPAYETAGNVVQKVTARIMQKDLSAYRQDNCVLLRVESVVDGRLQGYGVVLGDDNACYEKELLFLPINNECEQKALHGGEFPDDRAEMSQKEQEGAAGNVQPQMAYVVTLDDQFRPDLVENMPDQTNVGLSGFEVQLPPTLFSGRVMVQDVAATEYLPAGTYQIGMAVRNRVTGLRLRNVSNRFITIECKG